MAGGSSGRRTGNDHRGIANSDRAKRSPNGSMEGQGSAPVQEEPAAQAPVTARARRRWLNRRNVLLGLLGLLVLVVGGVATYVWSEVNKALPTINGTERLPGLSASVSVTRDKNGVPHIVASSVRDLYMAQGYVHAQDRLYQMFFFRTAGQGRLSELFSPGLVESDRYLRVFGFRRAAEAEWASLRSDVKEGLQAYADGVNAFVRTHKDRLPLEFTLLGIGFEEWHPVDSITFGKLQARDLTETWQQELVMADVVAALGPDVAAKLVPAYPKDAPVTVPGENSGLNSELVSAYRRSIAPLLGGWSEGVGSNNWAVSGNKSATGKPFLANDPHLGMRNPSIWYQIHLTTSDGKYDAAGFGFAGAPGIVTGHNQHIAWGVTNVGADVQDVFLEKFDEAAHPGQYQAASGWQPYQVITETIKVKGGTPYTQTVRITSHGPILSDAFPVTPTISAAISGTYSVQWSALEPGRLFEAVYDLQTARNWDEFRAALANWDVPSQNFVYADTAGNIGYQMTGKVPLRKKGDGSVPGSGWTGENDWIGYVAFDDLPRAYNPPEGFIATANNKPFGAGYAEPISGYWSRPWRIERIRELLGAKEKLGLEDMQGIQRDTVSLLAKRVLPVFSAIKTEDDRAKLAVDMMKAWDGDMKAESAAAAIFEITYQQALTRTFSDELGRDFELEESNLFAQYLDAFGGEALIGLADLLEKPEDALWDDVSTPARETRDDILAGALSGAVADLSRVLGDNMADWQWGKIHVVAPQHEFSSAQLVGGVFTLATQPIGGNNTTVAVASYPLPHAAFPLQTMAVRNHQSYRMVIDLANWSRSVAIFATGESGQPGSKFRENMYPLWLKFEYLPMYWTSDEIGANKEGVLTLTP